LTADWQADFTANITTEEAKQFRSMYQLVAGVKAPPPPTKADIAEALEKAADLIESETLTWVQGTEFVYGPDGEAIGACAIGLIARTCDITIGMIRHTTSLYGAVIAAVQNRLGMALALPTWNDQPGRTRIEVIELFKSIAKDLRNAG
jgi:hypothetical protein